MLNTLRLKAQALETEHVEKTLRMRNLHLALASLAAADELVEEIRKSRTHTKDKIELGNTAAEVYEEAMRICLLLAEKSLFKQAYWEKAFYFCEKSKSAVLLAAIQETNAKAYANIPADILEKEKALKADITLIERQLADRPPAAMEKNLREQLFALKNRYQDFVNKLEKQYEKYYNLKFNPKMVSVAEIQQSLHEETALVSYFVANQTQRLYIFWIEKNSFKVWDVPQIEKLTGYVMGLRNAIHFRNDQAYLKTAHPLFAQLFPKQVSKRVAQLIIVPDAMLNRIPFDALLTEAVENESQGYAHFPYLLKNGG
ncbi:MAG: hypothetical protein HC913_09070 [Microscillaceae bacterium]|nr:hypothetical protein [Microscillaceae bacterium]